MDISTEGTVRNQRYYSIRTSSTWNIWKVVSPWLTKCYHFYDETSFNKLSLNREGTHTILSVSLVKHLNARHSMLPITKEYTKHINFITANREMYCAVLFLSLSTLYLWHGEVYCSANSIVSLFAFEVLRDSVHCLLSQLSETRCVCRLYASFTYFLLPYCIHLANKILLVCGTIDVKAL